MNARKLEKNVALQTLDKVMSDGRRRTAKELRAATAQTVDAVSTAIAELRQNYRKMNRPDVIFECKRIDGLFYYRKVVSQ